MIADVLASYKLMKALNPEIVVTGHGPVTTTKTFDEYEGFYTLLLKRVGEMAAQGKSLAEIKTELKMPEYADWQWPGPFRSLHRRGVQGGEEVTMCDLTHAVGKRSLHRVLPLTVGACSAYAQEIVMLPTRPKSRSPIF